MSELSVAIILDVRDGAPVQLFHTRHRKIFLLSKCIEENAQTTSRRNQLAVRTLSEIESIEAHARNQSWV